MFNKIFNFGGFMNINYADNWQRKKIFYSKEHQDKAFETVNEIIFKERKGRKIYLIDGGVLIDFVSCSYLGLDLDERVIEAANMNLKTCGITFPAARTRIKAQSFVTLENLLNSIFANSFSVIFNSLHTTHLGFIPLLASGEMPGYPMTSRGPVFFIDKNAHASMQINRGLIQQFGKVEIIDFHDLNYLENCFKKAQKSKYTPIGMADSVGSMGGVSNVSDSLLIASKYGGYIYFDDAHGTSVFGKNGCGYVLDQLDFSYHPSLILTTSLSKAFGSIAGAIVLPTKKDAEFVKKYSSTYIFGGPPGLSLIDAAIASAKIHLSDEIYILQKNLQNNMEYFDSLIMPNFTLNYKSCAPLRGIFIGNENRAIQNALEMRKQGFALTTAMYPTVPKEHALLRIALSAAHTKEEIEAMCKAINHLLI